MQCLSSIDPRKLRSMTAEQREHVKQNLASALFVQRTSRTCPKCRRAIVKCTRGCVAFLWLTVHYTY